MAKAFRLDKRTALVTGSTRGIGRALALGLAAAGADIAVHGSGAETDAITELLDMIRAQGVRAQYFAADLGDSEACEKLASRVMASFGGVDILILNASTEIRGNWLAVSAADADRQWHVNVRSSLILAQLLTPPMIERRWGRIITLGSIQEVKPNPELMVYAATKAAQTSLVQSLARQLGPHGVTANNLAPGAISTDRNAAILVDQEYRRKISAQIPAGRIGTPDDCVGACLLLASDAGSYINGTTLFVDGGWHL